MNASQDRMSESQSIQRIDEGIRKLRAMKGGTQNRKLTSSRLLWLCQTLALQPAKLGIHSTRRGDSLQNKWYKLGEAIIKKCFGFFTPSRIRRLRTCSGLPALEQVKGKMATYMVRRIQKRAKALLKIQRAQEDKGMLATTQSILNSPLQ